jgi:hypothetical protein
MMLLRFTTYTLLIASLSAYAQENLHDRFEKAVKMEGEIRKDAKLIEGSHLSVLEAYGICLKQAQASKSPSISQCDYLIPTTLTGFKDNGQVQMLLQSAERETDAILSKAEELNLIVSASMFRTCITSGFATDICAKKVFWLEYKK